MNRRNTRAALRVEALEAIELLAGGLGVPLAGGTTGVGSVGSASAADVQALQQDSSGGSLEQFISEIEVIDGKQANVRQFAQAVVSDHRTTNFDLQVTAGLIGISLPTDIALPADVQEAKRVLAAVKKCNLDKTYLKVMAEINAQDVADDQTLISTTPTVSDTGTVPPVATYAHEVLAFDQNHLQGAQQLSKSHKNAYNLPTPPGLIFHLPFIPSPNPADADAPALQQDGSDGYLEQLISIEEVLQGTRSDVQQYAQSVVGDHQVTNYGLLSTVLDTGVTIQAGITVPSDIQDAKQVLGAGGKNLDKTYLKVMSKINKQDIQSSSQLASTSQVSRIVSYARETNFFDNVHYAGAVKLTQSRPATFTPGA